MLDSIGSEILIIECQISTRDAAEPSPSATRIRHQRLPKSTRYRDENIPLPAVWLAPFIIHAHMPYMYNIDPLTIQRITSHPPRSQRCLRPTTLHHPTRPLRHQYF